MQEIHRARRKVMAFLKSHYEDERIGLKLYGKTSPSCMEIVRTLVEIGELPATSLTKKKAQQTLLRWHKERHDLPMPAPKKGRKKGGKKANRKKLYVQSDDFLASWDWRTLRYKVLQKYGHRCMSCGASPSDGSTVICVDHIKPRRDFPELALDPKNLQVLCDSCNMGKGAWDLTDFRETLQNPGTP